MRAKMSKELITETVRLNGVAVKLVHSGNVHFARNISSADVAENNKKLRTLANTTVLL